MQKKYTLARAFLFIALFISACGGQPVEEIIPTPAPPTAVPTPEPTSEPQVTIQDLQAATVQIYAYFEDGGDSFVAWTGSGTIISSDGLILTNAHVADPNATGFRQTLFPYSIFEDEPPDPDWLSILLVEAEDKPPTETYIAKVVASDGILDLAVLQITKTIDGDTVDVNDLNLPFLKIGNSDDIHLGDKITVLGFPGIGQDTITLTIGSVSGFLDQYRVGDRAWIKTDTLIAGGNSGGLAANDKGEIVGVPTLGMLDLGGINQLRSINLAKPMIDAVTSGQAYQSPYITVDADGDENFDFVRWTVNDSGSSTCPTNSISNYESGVEEVSVVFDWEGLDSDLDYSEVWFIDGDLIFSTDPIGWDLSVDGECYVTGLSNGGNALPDGFYAVYAVAGPNFDVIGVAEVYVTDLECNDCVSFWGFLIDGDTGNPIKGAVVAIFEPGTNMEAWEQNPTEDPILLVVETNQNGFYEFFVPRGFEFPVLFLAEGYADVFETLIVSDDASGSIGLGDYPLYK